MKELTLKMRMVDTIEFTQALNACRQAFGFIMEIKRVNVWIYTFDKEDASYTREYLEQFGSRYEGRCRV